MNPHVERGIRRVAEFWQAGGPVRQWRIVLGVAAAAIVIWLLDAPKPWVVAAQVTGKMDTGEYVRIYGWVAGLINVVILGGLAILCPWWARPLAERSTLNIQCSAPKWFRPLVILAMVMTAWFALPRMNDSFWDDEELNIRTTLYGKFKTDASNGEVEFKRFDWLETVYGYKKGPNSHSLYSVLARACADVWDAIDRHPGFPVTEWPFRVPALIFGVLAVGTIAWMLKDFGMSGAGVVAAFLLAVHPWHIRYASEARGYSALICLIPVLFVCWHRAFASGSWRWWAALAATEFALIYSYPGMLIVLVVLNLITLARLAFGAGEAGLRPALTGRWFCVNAFAAMAAIQLMLPLYPQAKIYFDQVSAQGFVAGISWARNTVCFMLGGVPWSKSGDPSAGYPELLRFSQDHHVLFFLVAVAAVFVVVLGAVRLLRGGWTMATLVAVTFLCPPIIYEITHLKRILLYECYVIYSLPGIVACAAVGISLLAGWSRRLPGGRLTEPVLASLAVLAFFTLTHPYRDWITHHPLQQIRESVVYCRGTLDPGARTDKKVLTASFCIPPSLYDAYMDRLDTVGDFIEELHRADRENKVLYINIGMPWAAREYSPQMWVLFNNHELFDEPVKLRGFEPSLDRLIVRYKPHSADTFDFSSLVGAKR